MQESLPCVKGGVKTFGFDGGIADPAGFKETLQYNPSVMSSGHDSSPYTGEPEMPCSRVPDCRAQKC